MYHLSRLCVRRLKTGGLYLLFYLVYGALCGLLGWSLNVNGQAAFVASNEYAVTITGVGILGMLILFVALSILWTTRRRHYRPAPVPVPAGPAAAEA
jgi:hypothetical protein